MHRRFKRLASLKGKGSSDKGKGQDGEAANVGEESWGIIPDLVLIDGGKGHLSAALEVFLELGTISFIWLP